MVTNGDIEFARARQLSPEQARLGFVVGIPPGPSAGIAQLRRKCFEGVVTDLDGDIDADCPANVEGRADPRCLLDRSEPPKHVAIILVPLVERPGGDSFCHPSSPMRFDRAAARSA